jgi:DNA adenine methylase
LLQKTTQDTRQIVGIPFLKWAGGKRWLVQQRPDLFPAEFRRYFEPFLGGGAVYFHLSPKRAVLADKNAELIECYEIVRNRADDLLDALKVHQMRHSRAHYYLVRATVPCCEVERAARFLYLNRTCFNGLYRVNRNGTFNVPLGTKDSVLLGSDNFGAWSKTLNGASLVASDFEPIIDKAKQGDLVFADPPYTTRHNLNGFIKYNEHLFSWDDQVRLAKSLLRASKRGAYVVATNADHADVRQLYRRDFRLLRVKRNSLIASSSRFRGDATELVVLSK